MLGLVTARGQRLAEVIEHFRKDRTSLTTQAMTVCVILGLHERRQVQPAQQTDQVSPLFAKP